MQTGRRSHNHELAVRSRSIPARYGQHERWGPPPHRRMRSRPAVLRASEPRIASSYCSRTLGHRRCARPRARFVIPSWHRQACDADVSGSPDREIIPRHDREIVNLAAASIWLVWLRALQADDRFPRSGRAGVSLARGPSGGIRPIAVCARTRAPDGKDQPCLISRFGESGAVSGTASPDPGQFLPRGSQADSESCASGWSCSATRRSAFA